jgi:RNA polymerase sigma factor (sigma-70 family)
MTSPIRLGTMHSTYRLLGDQLREQRVDETPGRDQEAVLVTVDRLRVQGRPTTTRNPAADSSTDDAELIEVVAQARAGVDTAWEILVERFAGLVAAIARRCRLNDADVAEVSQTTWLRLVENLDRIQQPERLGAWLATTSRRESLRIATRRAVVSPSEAVYLVADHEADPLDAALLKGEQTEAIRMAADRLSPHCRRLLGVLMSDDDLPYKTIAEQLNMPIGSIGPTRGRCLEHLRQILADMELSQIPLSR